MSSKKRKVGGDAPPARVEDDTDEEDGGHPRPGSGVGGGASAPDDEEMGGVPLAGKRPRASMSQSDAGKGRASFTKVCARLSWWWMGCRAVCVRARPPRDSCVRNGATDECARKPWVFCRPAL